MGYVCVPTLPMFLENSNWSFPFFSTKKENKKARIDAIFPCHNSKMITAILLNNKQTNGLFVCQQILYSCTFFLIFKSSLCIRKLFAENKSVKDCMLRLSSQRTAPRGLVLNFCVQTSANFCTVCSICFQRKNLLLICTRLRHSKTKVFYGCII